MFADLSRVGFGTTVQGYRSIEELMNIFILTDNKFWFQKAKEVFELTEHRVSFFCSPKGVHFFTSEEENGEIQSIDVKKDTQFLIENFDLGFSCHCKQIFPKALVESVRCINVHPGLNPHNRGWFPQVFSILNKKPIGATIHLMDLEVDHGDILYQKEVDVFDWDTSKSIYNRVLEAEYSLFEDNLENLISGECKYLKVSNEGNYNSITDYKDLLEIDMDKTVSMREAIDYLRAMTHPPYKNAYFLTEKGEKVYVALDIEKEKHYHVCLKLNQRLTRIQEDLVREMELPIPEERWPFPKDAEGSDLIEAYKKGSLQECKNFIANIEDAELRETFEIIER